MGSEAIIGAVVPGLISGIFGEDTPSAPAAVSASNYETKMQNWLSNPIYQWAKQELNNAISKGNEGYDTSKLKVELDPTEISSMNYLNAKQTNTPTLTTAFQTYSPDSLYNSIAATATREADLAKQARLADLTERGLGNSTIIGDVTTDIDRNLADTLYKAKNDVVNQTATLNNQSMQLGNQAKVNQSQLESEGLKNRINTQFQIQDRVLNNQLYNKQADYNEWLRQRTEQDAMIPNIVSLFNGQTGVQTSAMNNANAINLANYQNQVQATRDQNQTIANVASQLFKKPTTTSGWGSGK